MEWIKADKLSPPEGVQVWIRIWTGTEVGLAIYDPKTEYWYGIERNFAPEAVTDWAFQYEGDPLHGGWR